MKQALIIGAAFVAGCVATTLAGPVRQALAQERPQIRLTPKSNYEQVLAGQNVWMLDSSNSQMVGCRFGGASGSQVICEKAKLP